MSRQQSPEPGRQRPAFLAWTLAGLLAVPIAAASGQGPRTGVLQIGTSGTLAPEGSGNTSKGDKLSLQRFIRKETGLKNEIRDLPDWQQLLDKMVKGRIEVGMFQGYEYAWAQEKSPKLKALAIAVSAHRYPVAAVVVRRDNAAKTFAGLRGQSLLLVKTNKHYLQLFVDRQCQKAGAKTEKFFSKVMKQDNFEDALDDVVDGMAQVTVADRSIIDIFKQRKPGRFRRLKVLAESQPFPSAVVAYYDTVLDADTLRRLRKGLLNAANKQEGRDTLTMFRLTSFEELPKDFDKVLAKTREAYPPTAPNR